MNYDDAKTHIDALFQQENAGLKDSFTRVNGPLSRGELQRGLIPVRTSPEDYHAVRDTYTKALLLQHFANTLVESVKPALQSKLQSMEMLQTNRHINEQGSLTGEQDFFAIGPSFADKIIREYGRDLKAQMQSHSPKTTPNAR